MQTSRFLLAVESGEIEVPTGLVGWLNASPYTELGVNDLTAAQPIFPDFTALKERGIAVAPVLDEDVEHCVVNAHRSKAATLELIGHALLKTKSGGMVAIDGDKTDGIESILKELKRRFENVASYSKAHGKLVWFTRPDILPDIDDWLDTTYLFPNGWTTRAGVFSADGPDQGSKLLSDVLPVLKGKVADLGAGWGYLTAEALKSDGITSIDGYEADYHAIACAKHNVTDPRAAFHWADVLDVKETGFDAILTNPPFHISRKPDPSLGAAFIRKAAEMLKPKGQLWLVANRTLPYEATLDDHFRQIKVISQTGGFKVIHAHTPKKARTN